MVAALPMLARAQAFTFCISVLAAAPTLYMFQVYDRVVSTRDVSTLAMLTLWVLGCLVLMAALEPVRSGLLQSAAHRFDELAAPRVLEATHQAQLRHMPHVRLLPLEDLRTLREFATSPAVSAAMELPAALLFLAALWWMSPFLAGVAGTTAVWVAALTWLQDQRTRHDLKEAGRLGRAAQQFSEAVVQQAATVVALGMLPGLRRRWLEQAGQAQRHHLAHAEHAARVQAAARGLQLVTGSALIGFAAWMVLHDTLWGGAASIIVASVLGGKAVAPLVQFVMQWRGVHTAHAAYRRLDELLRVCAPRAPSMALPAPQGWLTVERASVATPDGHHLLLNGLHFDVRPGEVMVVLGPSAAGKSTLARALVGVWPAASGEIRLDGVDLFTWDKTELGPRLGYLPQSIALLDGTLADNIARFGSPDAAAVKAAAELVGLDALAAQLPMGYETPLGPGGVMLSGGWRQRVGLARALYRRPTLVVLDEPNANLDEAGERALSAAIETCKATGTSFVIMSHRTRILAVADKILMLRMGAQEIVGPKDQVMSAITRRTPGAP